jgi:peptide/nickel transport system ATP-binding protein
MRDNTPVLETENLKQYFDLSEGFIEQLFSLGGELKAVDGVNLRIQENESVAIIGESGCGKSTLLRTLVGLYEPSDGKIKYNGKYTSDYSRSDWRQFRKDVQMIFQNPYESLDPKQTIGSTLMEALEIHDLGNKRERIRDILLQVGLEPVDEYLSKTSTALSGGEKQRVSIARAMIVEPKVVLADEPLSMLDVSTQASILNLFADLLEEKDLSLVYVSHDISTVSHICDEVNVMYLGRVIERARTRDIINDPQHPYTQALINSIPIPDPHYDRESVTLEGSPSDPIGLGEGCRFRDRCPERMEVCEKTPAFVKTGEHRKTACHLYYEHDRQPQTEVE